MTSTPVAVTEVTAIGHKRVAYLSSEDQHTQVSIQHEASEDGPTFTEGQVYSLDLELAADAPQPAEQPGQPVDHTSPL